MSLTVLDQEILRLIDDLQQHLVRQYIDIDDRVVFIRRLREVKQYLINKELQG